MGLDPSSPQMTLLLVMLHTGTMFAVIAFFWKTWKNAYFSSTDAFKRFAVLVLWATVLTGIVGEALKKIIEKTLFRGAPKAEIEQLFSHLELVAPALAAAGILILIAGLLEKRQKASASSEARDSLTFSQAGWMGAVQGLALALSRFLPIWLDHFHWHVGGRNQGACGAFQLRFGSDTDSGSGRTRGVAASKGVPCCSASGCSH